MHMYTHLDQKQRRRSRYAQLNQWAAFAPSLQLLPSVRIDVEYMVYMLACDAQSVVYSRGDQEKSFYREQYTHEVRCVKAQSVSYV
jgi:hypothetical protein